MIASGKPLAPPRLLLGVAFLYWGAVSGHPLVGLFCAFLVEARWWVDLRWHFGEKGFSRAWKLAILILVLAAVWLWMQGESVLGVFELLVWLPVLWLPVLLVQQYSVEERMPLNTFSYVAKRKMHHDRLAGREVRPLQVHIGYAYYCLILIAACLALPNTIVSIVALVVLGSVGLYFASPLGRMRPISWGLGLVATLLLAAVGGVALNVLVGIIYGGTLGLRSGDGIGDEALTAIGTLGEVKQSYRIRWRIGAERPVGSILFRTAGFNRYGNGVWNHRPTPPETNREEEYSEMFEGGGVNGVAKRWAFRNEDLLREDSPAESYRVRGAVHPRQPTPLPLAEGPRVLTGLETQGVTFNPLGTVRVVNPDRAVVDFWVIGGKGNLEENESAPVNALDLHVPPVEMEGLEAICLELGLHDLPDEEKVEALRAHFLKRFKYTLRLDAVVLSGPEAEQAITRFLHVARVGHCEYFATASALVLRQAGVPARYCEGFGSKEWDSERREWILRGIHAHAWCRAYLGGHRETQAQPDGTFKTIWTGGQWVDVDLTPPNWLDLERRGEAAPLLASVIDWWQRAREDFLIWRTRPAHRQMVTLVMSVLGLALLIEIMRRLWKHRTRRDPATRGLPPGGAEGIVTPLHALEKSARAVLGPRPAGVSLTRWLLGLRAELPGEHQILEQAVALHWKARFDPLGAEESERQQLEEACGTLRRQLRHLRRRR